MPLPLSPDSSEFYSVIPTPTIKIYPAQVLVKVYYEHITDHCAEEAYGTPPILWEDAVILLTSPDVASALLAKYEALDMPAYAKAFRNTMGMRSFKVVESRIKILFESHIS